MCNLDGWEIYRLYCLSEYNKTKDIYYLKSKQKIDKIIEKIKSGKGSQYISKEGK